MGDWDDHDGHEPSWKRSLAILATGSVMGLIAGALMRMVGCT
jgi:hypothetical protein